MPRIRFKTPDCRSLLVDGMTGTADLAIIFTSTKTCPVIAAGYLEIRQTREYVCLSTYLHDHVGAKPMVNHLHSHRCTSRVETKKITLPVMHTVCILITPRLGVRSPKHLTTHPPPYIISMSDNPDKPNRIPIS